MYDFVTGFFYLAIFLIFFLLVSINTSFLFTNEYYSIVHIYHNSFPRLFIHIAFFPPFAVVNTATENITAHVFWEGFQVFGCFMYQLEEELLGHLVILCLTFWGAAKLFKLFSMGPAWFHIPISTVDDSNFSMFLPTLIILHFLKLSSCGDRCRNISHCHFDLYFPHD